MMISLSVTSTSTVALWAPAWRATLDSASRVTAIRSSRSLEQASPAVRVSSIAGIRAAGRNPRAGTAWSITVTSRLVSDVRSWWGRPTVRWSDGDADTDDRVIEMIDIAFQPAGDLVVPNDGGE
jgi:hypothetical protein